MVNNVCWRLALGEADVSIKNHQKEVRIMDRKFSVFVSSTFEDLIEERQMAINAVMNAGHFHVGMEIFNAGNGTPLETIKEYMENTDVFLLILGGVYGSVEEGSKKSFTQLEYEHAVNVLKKPIIPLVLQDDYLQAKEQRLGISMFERERVEEYNSFKALIKSRHTAKNISRLEDVKAEVGNAIRRFENDKDIGGWQRVHSKTDKMSKAGIVDIYHPEALKVWQERPDFSGAKEVKLIFTSGTKFFKELQDSLREALAEGTRVKILLATPDSDFVKEIEDMQQNPAEGQRNFNDISKEIHEAIKTLQYLCVDIPGAELYLGHFNTQYRGNITIIDDKAAFYNPVLAPRPSSKLISMKVDGPLLADCSAHFDTLYKLLEEKGKIQRL